jgi:hypothetical protein
MRKLKLDLDDLTVEAFETVKSPAAEGTVQGHAKTCETWEENCSTVEYLSEDPTACFMCGTGFYSECCSAFCTADCGQTATCTHSNYTCGDACTQVC